jgi:serine protease
LTVTVPAQTAPFSPAVPSETKYTSGALWGLTGTYGVGIARAWQKTQGSQSIVVAVLDTGVATHSDLGPQVAGYDMIDLDDTTGDGIGDQPYIANDGDGRDANPADPGDWVSKAESAGTAAGGYFSDCPVDASSWHGTHVAGTVNAAINGFGSVGVAPNVSVQPVRVLGKCGGWDSDILAGILWAAGGEVSGVPINANPANVISLSLGGSGACPAATQTAIDYAWARNIVVTIAAGNENLDARTSSPGNCNHVITVAATDSAGKRASFSNYGALVEVAAPGVGIYSTLNSGLTSPSTESYASYSGTSMATPHVAGVVALILSRQPYLTPESVLFRLQSTATAFPGGRCDTATAKTCGVGIASAGATVR